MIMNVSPIGERKYELSRAHCALNSIQKSLWNHETTHFIDLIWIDAMKYFASWLSVHSAPQ